MSHLDGSEGLDPYISAYQSWENHVLERGRIESELAMRYRDLVNRYREKCAECEREKRNAIVWEREQSLTERELNGLKSAAVGLFRLPSPAGSTPGPRLTLTRNHLPLPLLLSMATGRSFAKILSPEARKAAARLPTS